MGDRSEVPEFDPQGPQLVYMAFADHIAARIAAGDLSPGSRLPSERELADEYGIAYMTVRLGMQELRERGLILTVHGKGTFVAEPPQDDTSEEPQADR
ncbi:GntR family transcriptional regulator [Spirillospora sp. NPDC029432]|uniref:GntR family transcriptional regulator n=1 Tax=Spirillospora sp. NPDC029432 TaxID=3154599 RepID=UPI0034531133